jgi:hypothetical protein
MNAAHDRRIGRSTATADQTTTIIDVIEALTERWRRVRHSGRVGDQEVGNGHVLGGAIMRRRMVYGVGCAAIIAAVTLATSAQDVTIGADPDWLKFSVLGDFGTGERRQYEIADRIGFAFALFFATAVYPPGPLLGEMKLGAVLSVGVPLAILAARLVKVGRFHAHRPCHAPAHLGHALAGAVLAILLVPQPSAAQDKGDVTMVFERHVNAYLELRQRAHEEIAPEHIIDPRIREISGALLAARVRQMRAHAMEGDVFTAPMTAVIRDRLHRGFEPTEVDVMLEQLYSESLPPDVVRINVGCSKDVLVVPPANVLSALPPLPTSLSYRLAGLDVVLWDEDVGIVVDIVRDALPVPRVWDFVAASSFELRDRIRESRRAIDLAAMMPPTILHTLPGLPAPLEYRFVRSDLTHATRVAWSAGLFSDGRTKSIMVRLNFIGSSTNASCPEFSNQTRCFDGAVTALK